MVNLFFLKTFADAAKSGSFQDAAHKNYITQPAVTQHIKILEEKLGCQLFERRNKKIFLTLSGKMFLTYAESILKQYDEAQMRIGEANNRFCCTLRLATIYSIGLYQLQPIVRKYLKKFPKIDIHLEYQLSDKIYQLVHDRLIDFGFVAYPKKRHGVTSEIFAEEEQVLIQSPSHPIFKSGELSFGQLNKARFVAFSANTPTRTAVDAHLRSKDCFPKIVNEYDNIETLKSAVTLGIGCSIVPKIAIAKELKDDSLEIVPLKGLELKRTLGILYPKGKTFSESSAAFLDLVFKSVSISRIPLQNKRESPIMAKK